MGDVGDVGAVGDDELEDRIAQQLASDAQGNRTERGDLADLVALDRAASQRLDVNAEQPEEPRGSRLRLPGRRGIGGGGRGRRRTSGVARGGAGARRTPGQLDQRVERVGVARLFVAVGVGGLEHLVDDRLVRDVEPGAVIDRAPRPRSSMRPHHRGTRAPGAPAGSARAPDRDRRQRPANIARAPRPAAPAAPNATSRLPLRARPSPPTRSPPAFALDNLPLRNAAAVAGSSVDLLRRLQLIPRRRDRCTGHARQLLGRRPESGPLPGSSIFDPPGQQRLRRRHQPLLDPIEHGPQLRRVEHEHRVGIEKRADEFAHQLFDSAQIVQRRCGDSGDGHEHMCSLWARQLSLSIDGIRRRNRTRIEEESEHEMTRLLTQGRFGDPAIPASNAPSLPLCNTRKRRSTDPTRRVGVARPAATTATTSSESLTEFVERRPITRAPNGVDVIPLARRSQRVRSAALMQELCPFRVAYNRGVEPGSPRATHS